MRSFRITLEESIRKGLRPTSNMPRNTVQLLNSTGCYPWEGSLKSLDNIQVFSLLPDLGESFPYPQVFVLREGLYVCGAQSIWEYSGGALVLRISGLTHGSVWTVADFGLYVLFCNGKVLVKRSPSTNQLSIVSDVNIPCGYGITNLNDQLIVAGPGTTISDLEVL